MHAVRSLLVEDSGQGWSLQRTRERVLKVAARVLVHARRIVVVVADSAAETWKRLWDRLQSLTPYRRQRVALLA